MFRTITHLFAHRCLSDNRPGYKASNSIKTRVQGDFKEGTDMRRMLAVAFLFIGNLVTFAQSDKPKPTYDFSLPREEKIKLGRECRSPEISGKATVYVLDRTGYTKAREGTNGFSCFMDRQTPWNTEPTCFDAEGTRTTLPTRLFA
jgi:hypothetical protein